MKISRGSVLGYGITAVLVHREPVTGWSVLDSRSRKAFS